MINKKSSILYFITALIIWGCGGVTGNIDRYKYNMPKDSLDLLIIKTFTNFPELKLPNSSIYKDDNTTKLCIIKDDEKNIVFGFSTLEFAENVKDKTFASEIVLTHAGYDGEILKLDKEIPLFKKYLFKELFKSKFVSKLDQCRSK